MTRHMRINVAELLVQLSERDRAILDALRAHRLLTTAMLRRLHFPHGPNGAHATEGAASGAAMRAY